ncbi:MAG TPA: response regulator [Chthoniobacter sp.]|nr:response regulator [Chthoniobacter sp.]
MAGESIKFPDVSKIFPQAEQQKIKPLQMQTFGDKPRVLLADDDPIHSLAVFQSLAQAGYEVVVAVTGTDAISELRKAEHPSVAILRSKLPGMTGIQICERMRDAAKDVYLIVYSDAPTSAEIVSGLESGADLLVPQSIPSAELVAYVKVGMRIIGRQAKS